MRGQAQQSAPPPSTCVSFTFPEKKPTARSLHLGPRLNRSSPACPSSSSDPLYSTPHLVSLLVGPNTTNLKTQNFFFFMLYIRFVCSEHPAAGLGETVSTADIEGSVGNWIEDIGQWPPHLLMKVHFIWVALSTLFRFYMLDIVYDRSQKRQRRNAVKPRPSATFQVIKTNVWCNNSRASKQQRE